MEPYYLSDVDRDPTGIYCHHDHMGEKFIPEHAHGKGQLLYTEGGIVYVRTPLETFFLPARHFMWLPAGMRHSIHPAKPEVVMRNLYFPVVVKDPDFFSQTGIYPVDNLLLELLLFTNRWNGNLKKGNPHHHIALGIKYMLAETGSEDLGLSLPMAGDPRLRQVLEHLEKTLGTTVTLADLARRFGFSERSLLRLFRKELGMTFIRYYTMRRMLRAVELLAEGRMGIGEIALEIGYNSLSTFSSTFYATLGKRPSAYLRNPSVLTKS